MTLELAIELQQSLLWNSIVEEMDKHVAFETAKLYLCTPEELPGIQARVLCYQTLTRLPADVIERET